MITAKFPPFTNDPVNYPKHYTQYPVQCIDIAEQMGFNLGNVLKYIWRADLKNGVQDLEKALWYLNREIANRNKAQDPQAPAPDLSPEAEALLERADAVEVD